MTSLYHCLSVVNHPNLAKGMANFDVPVTRSEMWAVTTAFDTDDTGQVLKVMILFGQQRKVTNQWSCSFLNGPAGNFIVFHAVLPSYTTHAASFTSSHERFMRILSPRTLQHRMYTNLSMAIGLGPREAVSECNMCVFVIVNIDSRSERHVKKLKSRG